MIPFNRADFGDIEISNATRAIASSHTSGNGPYTHRAEELLSDLHGNRATLLTTSGTHALEMGARLLNLQPGDEVIVPAYTFVTTASSFLWNGARPVFADIRDDTLNIDPNSVETAITSRTKAICIVHYAGVGADPDVFQDLALRHNLSLIEDNAHGLGGTFNGAPLGTFGDLSTLSFHETKNVSCGEGGAIVINDSTLLGRAEVIREKGTNRSDFSRGKVDKYTWIDAGSSWVPSDILAAILVGQLERFADIQNQRHLIWQRYLLALEEWARTSDVRLPYIPAEAGHSAHIFFLRLPSRQHRERFIRHMSDRGIMAVFHYQALHSSPFASQLQGLRACPTSEIAAETVVRLPLYSGLSEEQQNIVIQAVTDFRV